VAGKGGFYIHFLFASEGEKREVADESQEKTAV